MHYASRDTVTAFRNNYTHPANYTSLLNPNGLEVILTALHCMQYLQPATSKLRTLVGGAACTLAAFMACLASRCCQKDVTSVACTSRHKQRRATLLSNMPRRSTAEAAKLCSSVHLQRHHLLATAGQAHWHISIVCQHCNQ